MSFIAVALWGAFMMGAIFYTQEARHPDCKALPAYLMFVTIFSLVAATLFGALTMLLQLLNLSASLEHPAVATAFLVAVFLPAFFLGRRQIRKAPRVPALPERSGARRQSF
jgi:hypothetical protein